MLKKISLSLIFLLAASGVYSQAGRAEGQYPEFSIRTNVLFWAALEVNAGAQWRVNRNFGVLLHGGWSGWEWRNGQRVHRTWFVNPEARYYFSEGYRFYVGGEFHVGRFDLKFRDTGRRGNIIGAGATTGYLMRLGPSLDLDFSIGLGFTHSRYDRYHRTDGVTTDIERGVVKNLISPTQIGVTFAWKL